MMDGQFRAYLAATVASGLLAKHGIDHGGLDVGKIAQKSVDIADAIRAECTPEPESFSEPKPEVPAPAPNGDSGVAGSQVAQPTELKPVPPTADPSAAQE
jgi:hypothetical protein